MTEPANTLHLQIDATFVALRTVSMAIDQLLRSEPMADDGTIYNIQLAVQEICTNIVEYAYADINDGVIDLRLAVIDLPQRAFRVDIADTGHPFDRGAVNLPNLDELQEGGYGLFLVETLMDKVVYERGQGKNLWRLVKLL